MDEIQAKVVVEQMELDLSARQTTLDFEISNGE